MDPAELLTGTPHPKVVVTTLTGAVTAIIVAITKGAGDPATILIACLTVAQAVVGYLTPARRGKITLSTVEADLPQYVNDLQELLIEVEGTPADQITHAGAPGEVPA